MRIHIVGLPHTSVSRSWEHCAYTMKIHRLARMMKMYNIEMYLYADHRTDSETRDNVAEDVPIVDPIQRTRWWGTEEWLKHQVFDKYDQAEPWWREMNAEAAAHIAQRWRHGDLLGIIAGTCQEEIRTILGDKYKINAPLVEWGIGYSGICQDSFKVFESYAWRHFVAGKYSLEDVRWYDTVIPNAYDKDDFLDAKANTDEDAPVLFMARMIPRKGLQVVQDIVNTNCYRVVTCGQGDHRIEGAEHLGVVTGEAKKELLQSALAVLSPSIYLGPFEGISVESMMAGVPAITSDWGCYTETIPDIYRATTLQEFIDAIDYAVHQDRRQLQLESQARWDLEPVGLQYMEYFHKISDLYRGHGWGDYR